MSPLISTLKRVLKTRGVTYADLAEKFRLSEASVKRLFSQRTFTLERLKQLCAALEIDVFKLAKLSRGEQAKSAQLTVKQEQALPKDRVLPGVFYLVYNGWQIKLERLADEVHELAELDTMLPSKDRQTVGLDAGMRPWTVSMVSGLLLRKA